MEDSGCIGGCKVVCCSRAVEGTGNFSQEKERVQVSFSVIILSNNIDNLRPCIREIRVNEPNARIVVVDDGLEGMYVEDPRLSGPHTIPVTYVAGEKPFVFARNANIGIKCCIGDDVILLNDDAILKTPNGFSMLEAASKAHPEYGVIAAVADSVGNPNQMIRMPGARVGLRDEPRMVCFICVYIPRATIEKVGLLDERYTGYGLDDDDFCFSVRRAWLKIGVYDLCYVDHSTLRSSFRSYKHADFKPNLKLFIEKWGTDNWGKSRQESEFADLFPEVTV